MLIHMKVGLAIVHELRPSCQVDHDQVSTPLGVITAGCGVPSMVDVTYITSPNCHTDTPGTARRRTSESGARAVSVPALNHFFGDVVDNSVGGGSEGAVPWGGTESKIVARGAGAAGAFEASRPLSTGRPVQGRLVDDETRVLTAPNGGVRFGVYTGPMTTQTVSALTVSAAPSAAVAR